MLKGHLVNLRAVEEKDLPLLLSWRNDLESLYLWSTYRHIDDESYGMEQIVIDLRRNRHVTFIIERKREKEPIGFIYSYEFSLSDRHCTVTTFISREYKSHGLGAEGHALFLNYLFSYYDLIKVYADIYENNTFSLNASLRGGYIVEGRFPRHRFHNGEWLTMLRLALYRENLDKVNKLINRKSDIQTVSK